MATSRKPFRINVGFIVHEEIGYSHHLPLEFETAVLGGDLEIHNFKGDLIIDRTPQGLFLRGVISGTTILECVRCLMEFEHPLQSELAELYAFNKNSVSELGMLMPDNGHIDLEPIFREYAILDIPIKALCKPDCKGLCPECGQDLNIKDCGHRPSKGDNPFSILEKLK